MPDLLRYALGPVLLLQGMRVRRVTPVLPEPPGERSGVRGIGPPLRLLVLGDSSAAGVGAPTQEQALLGQTVARLAARRAVAWTLWAFSGDTTADALRRLDGLGDASFDVAVTALGVNDVTGSVSPTRWIEQQALLVAAALDAHGG